MRRRTATVFASCLAMGTAAAQDFSLHAYVDGRLVSASGETSWREGGLGKTRYGKGDNGLAYAGGGLIGTAQLGPAWLGLASIQLPTDGRSSLDIAEAWLRYRPVSTSRARWSLKAGSFFPPLSLENDAIGWTSSWTLTSSAINSWVGEELRSTGAEAQWQWRGDHQQWAVRGSVFHRNDPAGNLLAVRGWSLSDLVFGQGSRLREPDAYVRRRGGQPPRSYDAFSNIGNRLGWYVDVDWQHDQRWRVNLMRYDNRADPAAHTHGPGPWVYAWRTYFWSVGASAVTGPVTWIAQGMDGTTVIQPGATPLNTRYRSVFVLAGWNRGLWRPSIRIEHFSTRDPDSAKGLPLGEHGNAVTVALNYRPRDWLRLTAEIIRLDSTRAQRALYGLEAHTVQTQAQIGVRLMY